MILHSSLSFFLSLDIHQQQRRRAYYLYTCVRAREGFSIIYSACALRVNLILSVLRHPYPVPPVWTDSQITGSKADVSTVKRAADLGTNIAILHSRSINTAAAKKIAAQRGDFVPQDLGGLKKLQMRLDIKTLCTHYLAQRTLELLAISSVNWQIKTTSDNCHECRALISRAADCDRFC
jgi:hypothetical protein